MAAALVLGLSGCTLQVDYAREDRMQERTGPPPEQESVRLTPSNARRVDGDVVGLVGLGQIDDPDAFLLGGQIEFYQTDRLAIGPMLQVGLDDDLTVVAPSLFGKFRFPLMRVERLTPFAQGGIGFLWAERNRPGGNEDDIGFMLQAGGGVEWQIDQQLFLAGSVVVDLLPSDVLNENVILTWQIVQIGYRF
jgi:hypothetical protein